MVRSAAREVSFVPGCMRDAEIENGAQPLPWISRGAQEGGRRCAAFADLI